MKQTVYETKPNIKGMDWKDFVKWCHNHHKSILRFSSMEEYTKKGEAGVGSTLA